MMDGLHRWTHYKVALHSQSGYQQRVPSLAFSGEGLFHQQITPSTEWYALPLTAYETIHVSIPSTIYSETCMVTLLLRGDHGA